MSLITILVSGTRGDVLPYLALGHALQQEGYTIRIAAPSAFQPLIQQNGLPCAPFEGNPSDLMLNQTDPLTLGRNPLRSFTATQRFLQQARALYPRMLPGALEACRGADLLIYSLPTLWGAHIAEGLHIPAIRAVLQPISPTRQFSSTLLPFRLHLGKMGNWLSHWIVLQTLWLIFLPQINRARQTHLNLPPAHWLDPTLRPFPNQPLTLNGFSEHIVPRPADWNEKQIITGYWRLPASQWTPPQPLLNYLEQSPHNTVAIGFGSPGTREFPRLLRLFEEALQRSNARAVAIIPLPYHTSVRSNRIFPIEYAPHDWLYPRVRAAVHHGGAGTTAACLHAGIPAITMPLAIDQFFWGERIHRLGVAPRPIPQRSLTARKLTQALQTVLQDVTMQAQAQKLAASLSRENGAQAAANVIRSILPHRQG